MAVTGDLEITDLIREIRRRLRLTQEKFAARLGVTCLTVNRWENGRTKPSPLALQQIEGMLRQMDNRGQDLLAKYFPKDISSQDK